MKYIEIITLRSLGRDNRQLVDELLRQIFKQFKQKEPGVPPSIRVYHHALVETDLSIHVHWEVEAQHPGESPLGQRLCYALKGLGQCNHSLWVEAAAWNDHQ